MFFNYNTSYHTSIGCEPSRFFHGRIPYNTLDLKLPAASTLSDFANCSRCCRPNTDGLPRCKKLLCKLTSNTRLIPTKRQTLQLKEADYLYGLPSKADHQGSKFLFTEFRWIRPYIFEKVLPINNCLVGKIGTNKTQGIHRMQMRQFTASQPIPDIRITPQERKLDPDVSLKQADLYARAWSVDMGSQFLTPKIIIQCHTIHPKVQFTLLYQPKERGIHQEPQKSVSEKYFLKRKNYVT